MLAYVFWHWPTSATAEPSYETAMLDFHERLRDAGSPALPGSRTFRVEGEPWLPEAAVMSTGTSSTKASPHWMF